MGLRQDISRLHKILLAIIGVIALLSAVAYAGSIKVWSGNESLTASQLNANFSHIHNAMVGGHGAKLVNADVSATAAISFSKLATPELIPKAWAQVATCTTGTCTVSASSGFVGAVTRGAQGSYTVALTSTRPNANYTVIATYLSGGSGAMVCTAYGLATTQFFVDCVSQGSTTTSCTLAGGPPSTCTITVPATSFCVCSPVGITAVIAAGGCATSLSGTTLTAYSAAGLTNVVNARCISLQDSGFGFVLMDNDA